VPKKAIIYCKASSHNQKQKGDLERQKQDLLDYATLENLENRIVAFASNLKNKKQIVKLVVEIAHSLSELPQRSLVLFQV